MGTKLVVLTGGDPAKRPDIVELVRHGTYRGLRMALTPSATPLVTREWLERLRDAGVARVAISIDGASAATHDRFRGVVGSWARSHQILDHARSLGLSTQANTSVSARNVSELALLATQLADRRIDLWGVFFVVPLYLQLVIGLDALDTGLRMLPISITMFLFSATFYPLTVYPEPIQWFIQALPL